MTILAESNLGTEAQEIGFRLVNLPYVTIACRKKTAYGVATLPYMREKYVFRLGEKLTEDAIWLHRPIISANPYAANTTAKQRAVKQLAKLESQIRSFRRIPIIPKTLTASVRYAYESRVDADGKWSTSIKNDVAMAFMIGLFWSAQLKAGFISEVGHGERLQRLGGPDENPRKRGHDDYDDDDVNKQPRI